MLHTSYFRLSVRTGQVEELPFGDVDGYEFGVRFERGEDVVFSTHVALRIVNKWNSFSRLAPSNNPNYYYIYWI